MFRLFSILLKMSEATREELILYNSELFDVFEIRKHDTSNVHMSLPTTVADMKALITQGKHSIMKNFPVQEVFEIDNHACVSLIETIRIMAGHGAKFCFAVDEQNRTREGSDGTNRNREGLNGTKAMDDLIDGINEAMMEAKENEGIRTKTKIGWLNFWSDGFLNCFTKQRENSVWIITVTVSPPSDSQSSNLYTYVLAMAKHDADHTRVIEHYMREVSVLKKGIECYFGSTNTIEHISLDILAWIADRPEGHELTNTRKEGTYGKVNGWAVNVSEEHLPACKKCYVSLIKRLVHQEEETLPLCKKCTNWSLVREENGVEVVQCMNDTVPKDYPKEYTEDSNIDPQPAGRTCSQMILPPKKLDTQWMLQAVQSGYFGVRIGNWGKPAARQYLRTCNINTKTAESIIESALEDKLKAVLEPERVEPLLWKQINCFTRFKFPLLPLHGLCHGVVPDVMSINHHVFKKYKKMGSFCQSVNPILKDLESFGLSWLKVKQLPKAAWVGENSLAIARLMSYLYGSYLMNNTLCGTASETGKSDKAKITVKFLLCLLNSFQSLMSIYMSKTAPSRKVIDDHIKLFMSSAHYLHKQHGQLDSTDKGNRGGTSKRKFFETLSGPHLKELIREFEGISNEGKVGDLRRRFNNVTMKQLREKIEQMSGEKTLEKSKEELHRRLYDEVIPKDDKPDNASKKRRCAGTRGTGSVLWLKSQSK